LNAKRFNQSTDPEPNILMQPQDAGILSTTGSSGMPFIDIKSSYDHDALAATGFKVWLL